MTLARRASSAVPAAIAAAVLAACPAEGPTGPVTGPATITILGGGPVQGVEVLFHEPDGSVRSRALTGADGKATAVVAPGALATVVGFFPGTTNAYSLDTVAGLNPGDAVLVGTPTPLPMATGQVDVTLPGDFVGASSYRVDIGCGYATAAASDAPVSVLVRSSCGTTVSAVAVAIADGGIELAFSTATDIPLSGAPPALAGSITLPAWTTDFGSLALTASSAPAGASLLYSTLEPRRNGVRFHGSEALASVAPGGSAALALPFARGLGTSSRLSVSVMYAPLGPGGNGTWMANDVDPSTPGSIDLTAGVPPRLSPPSVSGAPGALTASWTSAGTDPSLDAQFLDLVWPGTSSDHYWRVMLPPGPTSFAFPTIPDDLAAWLPPPGAPSLGGIRAVDMSTVVGYQAFKATYWTSFMHQTLPESGAYTIRTSAGML
jgi:hypothetical protein